MKSYIQLSYKDSPNLLFIWLQNYNNYFINMYSIIILNRINLVIIILDYLHLFFTNWIYNKILNNGRLQYIS